MIIHREDKQFSTTTQHVFWQCYCRIANVPSCWAQCSPVLWWPGSNLPAESAALAVPPDWSNPASCTGSDGHTRQPHSLDPLQHNTHHIIALSILHHSIYLVPVPPPSLPPLVYTSSWRLMLLLSTREWSTFRTLWTFHILGLFLRNSISSSDFLAVLQRYWLKDWNWMRAEGEPLLRQRYKQHCKYFHIEMVTLKPQIWRCQTVVLPDKWTHQWCPRATGWAAPMGQAHLHLFTNQINIT